MTILLANLTVSAGPAGSFLMFPLPDVIALRELMRRWRA
jgi:hypothetical protein